MSKFCSICGGELLKVDKFKPSTYCSDPCRDYSKFKTALQNSILKIKPTPEARKLIRGDMFRLCNLLSNGTNTFYEAKK